MTDFWQGSKFTSSWRLIDEWEDAPSHFVEKVLCTERLPLIELQLSQGLPLEEACSPAGAFGIQDLARHPDTAPWILAWC